MKDVYNLFSQEAEQYQEFWQAMDELDSGCWILEPETPFLSDTYRKIAVSKYHALKKNQTVIETTSKSKLQLKMCH